MNKRRHLNNLEDRLKLGRDLERLTDRYEREGFDPHSLHLELATMVIGWLIYNGMSANDLRVIVEDFVTRLEEAQAESTTLQ